MKILTISGDHPRHLFFINQILTQFEIDGAIIQKRENILPEPPTKISDLDLKNFIKHFTNRDKAEQKYFGKQNLPNCDILEVNSASLNYENSIKFVETKKPDLVLIFGSSLIKNPLFSKLPHDTINLHLGISPRYRGAATLFWPFYFMEPTYCGSTFHYIVSEPDAGKIIHQSQPKLSHDDGIHDVACKTVIESSHDILGLLRIKELKSEWVKYDQKGSGKNFLNSDFKPEHLRVIYNIFNDDMVKRYLDGELACKTPVLIRQL